MRPILGILLGDACGIGPEIVSRLCANENLQKYCKPILIGDLRVLEMGKETAKVNFAVNIIEDLANISWDEGIPMYDLKDLDPSKICIGAVNTLSGNVAANMLKTALRLCQKGVIDGFVYGPLNKAALQLAGYDFPDELRLMADYLNWHEHHSELNVLNNLWTSRVTSHIPIKQVSEHLYEQSIIKAVELLDKTIKSTGVISPRIAVAALNPHAGESGLCGREEIDVIAPAINYAKSTLGIDVSGPYPSDTIFINANKGAYDGVVTMFHDQGQIAIKLLGFQFGVTVNGGLPYPITTPAHGTAFDIAGKGIATSDALEQAVILATKMVAKKKEN